MHHFSAGQVCVRLIQVRLPLGRCMLRSSCHCWQDELARISFLQLLFSHTHLELAFQDGWDPWTVLIPQNACIWEGQILTVPLHALLTRGSIRGHQFSALQAPMEHPHATGILYMLSVLEGSWVQKQLKANQARGGGGRQSCLSQPTATTFLLPGWVFFEKKRPPFGYGGGAMKKMAERTTLPGGQVSEEEMSALQWYAE